jgi:hypothetical protein
VAARDILHNPVFEISNSPEGAVLTHGRAQQEGDGAFHLSMIHAQRNRG